MTIDRRMILGAFAASAASGLIAGGAEGDVYVIADLLAKPEAAGEFRQMLIDFVAKSRKETGCKHYTLLEDPAKPVGCRRTIAEISVWPEMDEPHRLRVMTDLPARLVNLRSRAARGGRVRARDRS
jgi:predicted Fe-S protein YdhL (DUF1289 family)